MAPAERGLPCGKFDRVPPYRRSAVVATLVLLCAARPARADAPAPLNAAQLFDQARELMAQGRYAEACGELESSEALDPGIGTEFNLARCYELAGRLASARAMYRRVMEETHAAGQTDRETVARDLSAQLQSRVAHLVLQLAASPSAALEIRVDGALVPVSEWSAPREMDTGPHEVAATAPGFMPWKSIVRVEREGETVSLGVPALVPRAAVEIVVPPAPASVARPITSETAPRGSSQRVVALALGAFGLAGVVPGTYFGLHAQSLESQAAPRCLGGPCDPTGYADRTSSRWNGDASTVTFFVSAALLAAAGIVWFTAPNRP